MNVTYFFREEHEPWHVEESFKDYGYATKSDLEELAVIIKQLKREIAVLKKDIAAMNAKLAKRKK
ncbi:MAG: hypothetical protein ABIR15_18785 [Chitinophagaceae bacterium]